ncbi:MAG TPA: GNAT family N-acetyltransferase [Gaiellaceae bacterium]|nr:GNAT family N-acetyltransferase [Gaiellaceae bacterium]
MDAALPLHRLDGAGTYLVAWDGDDPLGHAHFAWGGTRLGVPEIQDVYVLPDRRRGDRHRSDRRRGGARPHTWPRPIRGEPVEVDDTVRYLVKDLGVDSSASRSS